MSTFQIIKRIVLRFMKKMKRDRISASAAESAFFVIMGFVPFFLLMLTVIQYTLFTPEMLMELLYQVMPPDFYDLIADIVKNVFTQSTALLSGSVITAIWATSRSVLAITNGLNAIRDVKENRNYFYMRARSAVYIIFFLAAIFMAMVTLLFGNRLQRIVVEFVPVLGRLTGLIISFRMTITLCIMAFIFLALYTALPNCRMHVVRQIPGAFFTAVFWSVLASVFSLYLKYFAGRSIYGSLSTVVMMMFWLYFCMWSLFVGAELNCYLEYPDSFLTDHLQ